MRLLLDTHCLIWWWAEFPDILGTKAYVAMGDPMNDIFVSSASAWEIATKNRKHPIDLPVPIEHFTQAVTNAGFIALDVNMAQVLRAGGYDADHRDPFDRLLAAQAELEGLTLLTCDSKFSQFPCMTLWN